MDPVIVHTARVIIGFVLITIGVATMARTWRDPMGTPLGTGVGASILALGIKAMYS